MTISLYIIVYKEFLRTFTDFWWTETQRLQIITHKYKQTAMFANLLRIMVAKIIFRDIQLIVHVIVQCT